MWTRRRARWSTPPSIMAAATISPRWSCGATAISPETEATDERVRISPHMHAGREPPQQLGIATADHYAVDLQPESEQIDHFENVAPPFFLARSLQARRADILFVGSSFFERQVCELHRLEPAVDDHGGAETGAETEKQHASARIAAERLHRGIVDHFHRPAECAPEIEANPTLAEVNRLAHRLA